MSNLLVRRLDVNGEPCFGHGESDFVSGTDAVVVLCTLALRLTLGRWFLDTTLGVAWLQPNGARQILGQSPADIAFARSEVLRVLWRVQGVASVESLVITFDERTRIASVVAKILTVFDDSRTIDLKAIP